MRLRPILGAALLAALAGACERGGGGAANPMAGSYRLLRTTTSELPARVAEYTTCHYVLTGATLDIDPDSTYASRLDVLAYCPPDEPVPDTTVRADSGTYRIEGDSLFFYSASGRASGAGAFVGDSLRIAGPAHTLIYLRGSGR